MSGRATNFAVRCALTAPETDASSVKPRPAYSSDFARYTKSSGWDAPVKNVKLDVQQSSANML